MVKYLDSMETLKQQIRGLLAQDVMLEQSFKSKVLSHLDLLKEKQLQNIVLTLQKLVAQEEAIITRTLENKPFLFNEIQHQILLIMHEEFVKIEVIEHEHAETELADHLKVLFA